MKEMKFKLFCLLRDSKDPLTEAEQKLFEFLRLDADIDKIVRAHEAGILA